MPIGTGPAGTGAPGAMRAATQPTVASVGPYSLITATSGCAARQAASCSPVSASPPMTRSVVGDSSASSSGRWLGVTLRKVGRPPARAAGLVDRGEPDRAAGGERAEQAGDGEVERDRRVQQRRPGQAPGRWRGPRPGTRSPPGARPPRPWGGRWSRRCRCTYAGCSGRSGATRSASVRSSPGWSEPTSPSSTSASPGTSGGGVRVGQHQRGRGVGRAGTRSARPGTSVSTGTYAAPAFSTASIATTRSQERGRASATRVSGPAPRATSSRASRFAAAFSSA